MKKWMLLATITLCFAGLASGAPSSGAFVCPPCGCEHDGHAFQRRGRCPSCGMELIQKERITDVAIVLFEGVQIIDFTGPYEVFGQASYRVFTVSETGAPLTTAMGLKVDPTYSIAESPPPHIIVVPGGETPNAIKNRKLLAWIAAKTKTAKQVMSVCNGAFILAKAGLLEGRSATTFYRLLDALEEASPKTKVVWDQRFVDTGKIVTTAGLSSGIDGALHVISKLEGRTKAVRVALHLEYDWRPEDNYARAALADMHLPDLKAPDDGYIEIIETTGDREKWTKVLRFGSMS